MRVHPQRPTPPLALWLLLPAVAFSPLPGEAEGVGSGLAARDTAAVEGAVVEAGTSEPVRGAVVSLPGAGRSTVTDREGRFRMEGVAPGSLRVRVEALGYHAHEEELEVGTDGISVEVALDSRPVGLREVVATGTPMRGAAPVQPGQAYRGEDLQLRAADSFGEVLDGEPGLAMRSFGPVAGRPVVRGLDGDRVAVLEGGQRMGDMSETAHDHAVAMEPLLAQGVEVVRGPGSLLYGSSALGGVVNLLREDVPAGWSPGPEGRVSVQGASVNRLVAGAGSGTYGSDRWAATGRASIRAADDFRAPGSPGGVLESTHNELLTGGAGVAWRNDGLRAGGGLDLHEHVYGVPEDLDDPDEEVEIRSERQRFTGELDWRASGFVQAVEVRVAASRFRQREVEVERLPGGPAAEEVEHDFERRTLDADVTATHGERGPLGEGAVGVSLRASTLAATGADEFHPDGQDVSGGLFAFQRVPLAERLEVQGGVRLEYERTRATENELFPGFSARRTATAVSGALGISARPGERLEMGAQVARAHRSPMLEQLYSQGPHLGAGRYEVGEPELRNEVGHGLDAFARYASGTVEGEVALFANRIRDYVLPVRTGESDPESGLPVVRWSAEEARFVGGEARVEAAATPHLHVSLTGDYVRAAQRDGTPLPFIPPARASMGATYDRGGWWLGGSGRGVARQERVPEPQDPTAGYVLLDLHGGLRLGQDRDHAVVVRMDNALDAVYRDHLSRVDERRFPMPGRNLTVVYRWVF